MFDRLDIKIKICRRLQTDYVALLGQQGTGVRSLINSIVNEKPPIPGMKFIFIPLPRGLENDNEFKEYFLKQLIDSASSAPPKDELADTVVQAIKKSEQFGVDFRLREALSTLGKGTTAHPLVIVLNALPKIKKELLKNLLLMLREYHEQRNIRDAAGEKLRFLVAGRERLWFLCRQNLDDVSPFNIAELIFLNGLSFEEIQTIDESGDLEAAVRLRDLTDGIPSLIERSINIPITSEDLSPFFECLQDNWNSLPTTSRDLLKELAENQAGFPQHCMVDFKCPQIPEIESPWIEAFWTGFLRMRHREITWRSPIHRAFVMERMQIQGNSSKSAMVKVDLLARAERLEKVLKETQNLKNSDDCFDEALFLSVQAESADLTTVLEMLRRGEKDNVILEALKQSAERSKTGWIKEIGKEVIQKKETIGHFLTHNVILGLRRSLGDYDVFLCHNSKDKDAVKKIGRQLKERGILPWLDEWDFRPGLPWQDELDKQIKNIKSVAVFIGPEGLGPWQDMEIKAFLRKFVDQGCPIIPVILQGCEEVPNLPYFLDGMTWVDFRKEEPDPFEQLIWGITGEQNSLI